MTRQAVDAENWGRDSPGPLARDSTRSCSTITSDAAEAQTIVGDEQSGEFGKHTPLVVIEPQTSATAMLANASETPLSSLTLSVTQFPVDREQRYLPGAGKPHSALRASIDSKNKDVCDAREVAIVSD